MSNKSTTPRVEKSPTDKLEIGRRPAGRGPLAQSTRPLPEIGQTEMTPDPEADRLREHPTTGTASRGSATSRKI
jgi:hypothetical protein